MRTYPQLLGTVTCESARKPRLHNAARHSPRRRISLRRLGMLITVLSQYPPFCPHAPQRCRFQDCPACRIFVRCGLGFGLIGVTRLWANTIEPLPETLEYNPVQLSRCALRRHTKPRFPSFRANIPTLWHYCLFVFSRRNGHWDCRTQRLVPTDFARPTRRCSSHQSRNPSSRKTNASNVC